MLNIRRQAIRIVQFIKKKHKNTEKIQDKKSINKNRKN